jgi:hypothetical protein
MNNTTSPTTYEFGEVVAALVAMRPDMDSSDVRDLVADTLPAGLVAESASFTYTEWAILLAVFAS